MKQSPFIYGSTVSSNSFTNRVEDSRRLYNNLLQGINTMIISPRRWGKSSLVEKVINDINQKKKHKNSDY
jgi:AAA+ ATPase superfamily predicted ATPase